MAVNDRNLVLRQPITGGLPQGRPPGVLDEALSGGLHSGYERLIAALHVLGVTSDPSPVVVEVVMHLMEPGNEAGHQVIGPTSDAIDHFFPRKDGTHSLAVEQPSAIAFRT